LPTAAGAHPSQANWTHMALGVAGCARGKNAIAAVGLLVHRNIMRYSSKQIQFAFDPAKDFLWRSEKTDVTQTPCCVISRPPVVSRIAQNLQR
jgi:hypothetical protein